MKECTIKITMDTPAFDRGPTRQLVAILAGLGGRLARAGEVSLPLRLQIGDSDGRIVGSLEIKLAEAAEDEVCTACGRASIDCSRKPCPAVIHDRDDLQTDYPVCGACDRPTHECMAAPCMTRRKWLAEVEAPGR